MLNADARDATHALFMPVISLHKISPAVPVGCVNVDMKRIAGAKKTPTIMSATAKFNSK